MPGSRLLAITPGDPEGIGPEIVWKTLARLPRGMSGAPIVCVGAREPFDRMGVPVREVSEEEIVSGAKPPRAREPHVWILGAPAPAPRGKHLHGFQSGWAIEAAARLVKNGVASAIVTGPISKERLRKGGYSYPGHTEMLADLCGRTDVTMMLANERLRITLVTTHLALKDVPTALRKDDIKRCVIHTFDSLRNWWGIRRPRIAVLALNPHAGEAGLFGDEETRIIGPAIRSLQEKLGAACDLSGPHPADTLFAKHVMADPKAKANGRYDAVVCMYHDQGLIPVKLLDFPRTVNVTLGLPIVRTSVDHGVGFDIAGKGIADPSSLQSALKLAVQITQTREKTRGSHETRD